MVTLDVLGVFGTVRITRADSGLFDLASLDVTFRNSLDILGTFDLLTSQGGAQNLAAIGNYSFSGAPFQALTWVDLIGVNPDFFADNNTVDNIVLNPTQAPPSVPEPSSALAGLLAALGLFAFQKLNALRLRA